MKKLRHLAEIAGLLTTVAIVERLPLAMATGLAHGLTDLAYLLGGRRRRIAIDNVLRSGLATSPRGAARLARASFRSFALMIVETIKAERVFRDGNWGERATVEIPAELEATLGDPKSGLVLATGHIGNWEVAAHLLGSRKPLLGVARKMNNPYVDRWVRRRMERMNFRTTPKHDNNMLRMIDSLKKGNVLALMIDQYAPDNGCQVDFFGRPASTYTAVALLHLVTRIPLYFGYCVRTGPMQFAMRASGPIDHAASGDKQADIRAILSRLTEELEAAIRAHPEQYLWGHRRWRD